MGLAADGMTKCTSPLISEFSYSVCINTHFEFPDAALGHCMDRIVGTVHFITTEAQTKAIIECVPPQTGIQFTAPSITLAWAPSGSAIENVLCRAWAYDKYGFQMAGWAFVSTPELGYFWDMVAYRRRTAECPHGYGEVLASDRSLEYCKKDAAFVCEATPNPMSIATGERTLMETDYPAVGASPLTFSRSYSNLGFYKPIGSALLPTPGFGEFWRHSYSHRIWPENSPHLMATVTRPNGAEKHFRAIGPEVLNTDGARDRLTRNTQGQWLYRAAQGALETYANGQLISIHTAFGGKQTMRYSTAATPASVAPVPDLLIQVSDTFGRNLDLTYNDKKQLRTLTDPLGGVYEYDFNLDNVLTQVRYPDASTRQYVYRYHPNGWNGGPHSVTGVIDELGVRFATYGYSFPYGGIAEHAGGVEKYTRFGSNSGPVVTMRNPQDTDSLHTIEKIKGVGRVTSQTQSAGAGCAPSMRAQTFDANGNITRRDDLNATRTCYAQDPARNLESARVEGLPQTAICTNLIAANATLPTGSRKTSTQWHPDWPVETKRAEPSRITTWVYNGQTDPFTGTVATCAPADALLPDGRPIVVLCKEVQQATTDVSGAKGFSAILQTTTAQRQTLSTYNQHGQLLTTQDSAGNITTHAYYADTTAEHTTGDRQSTTNARAQATQFTTYNKAGQLLRSIDPNGVTTTHTYDPRQRLTGTQVGTQLTTYTYDAAGQLKKITLPDASWIGFEFDAAHRQTAVFDNQGNRIDYTLDNSGRRVDTKTKDPAGQLARQSQKVLDALSRVQQTTGQ
jgi:YD repeat-containing protein